MPCIACARHPLWQQEKTVDWTPIYCCSYFDTLGLDIVREESSNSGRLDMTLKFNSQVFLFEFKVVELAPEGRAFSRSSTKAMSSQTKPVDSPFI